MLQFTAQDSGGGASSAHRPKVLVVDDDVFIVRLIARTLEADATVVSAYNGRDGLDLALAERPDLIILDYVMPDVMGDDICRLMRAHDELTGVKIVFLTSHGRFLSRESAVAAGADAILIKPFSPITLIDLVTSLLAR